MVSLARKNLFHDKIRLAVTLTGVIFAVVLVAVQIGLFIGFTRSTSNLVEHSGADVWVMTEGVGYVEIGQSMPERKRYKVLSVPGVAAAEKYIVRFAQWKMPSGAEEGIEIVGFDVDSRLGGPWNVVEGDVSDLDLPDTVVVDRLYREKLGVTHLGQTVEINGRRARIVAFTEGIRTFTTSPAVFASFETARRYAGMTADETTFLLVRGTGVAPDALAREIDRRVEHVDAWTRDEFSAKTSAYWMFGTGAGVTVLIAAALGLVVGVVVVAQTIYAATVDHLREFGTLKAMGATNGYIYRVIVTQALWSAVIGYGFGIAIAYGAVYMSRNGGAAIVLPGEVGAALFLLTLVMCVAAALVSINKATRIDPAMVFKG
jgi:putative ABC transport system permease protein